MNYQIIHDDIIHRAKSRTPHKNLYYENHHITPKCEGGLYEGFTVKLTHKEHRLVHLLRYKMTGVKGNLSAYLLMGKSNPHTSPFKRREDASFAAKMSHKKRKENDPDEYQNSQSRVGSIGGKACHKNELGMFSMTEEKKKEARKRGGESTASKKLGMFSDEYRKEHSRKMQKVVLIDGIEYDSCTLAAKSLNVTRATISNWINKGKAVVLSEGEIRRKMYVINE